MDLERVNDNINREKILKKQSKFKNNFNKNRNNEKWFRYNTQRNYCVTLLRKLKKPYFRNTNISNVSDNKSFWKSIKPYFSTKRSSSNKITPVENDVIITKVISKTMSIFFINRTKKLNLNPFNPTHHGFFWLALGRG